MFESFWLAMMAIRCFNPNRAEGSAGTGYFFLKLQALSSSEKKAIVKVRCVSYDENQLPLRSIIYSDVVR